MCSTTAFSVGNQWYYPLSKNLTLMLNGELGMVNSWSSKKLPFYENFYLAASARCGVLNPGTIGAQDENNNAYGGTAAGCSMPKCCFTSGAARRQNLRLSPSLTWARCLAANSAAA